MSSITSTALPALPYEGFPLRPHKNGSWYKSVWNPRTKKSEQFYFGSWRDDRKGDRAIRDPEIGYLARRDAIKAGIDNVSPTFALPHVFRNFLGWFPLSAVFQWGFCF